MQIAENLISEYGSKSTKLETVTIDFEVAIENAIKFAFPKLNINGCLYHYARALNKKGDGLITNNDIKIEIVSELLDLSWDEVFSDNK